MPLFLHIGEFCFLQNPNLQGSQTIPLKSSELETVFTEYSSEGLGSTAIIKVKNNYLIQFSAGDDGCIALLGSVKEGDTQLTLAYEKLKIETIWKQTLFYISGLSKLNHKLANLKMLFAATSELKALLEFKEAKMFPEYHLRALAYINETNSHYNTDNDFEKKLYESYWKELHGPLLTNLVKGQFRDLDQYISERKKIESERRTRLWGVRISIITILFTVISLLEGAKELLYVPDSFKGFINTHCYLKWVLPLVFVVFLVLIFTIQWVKRRR